MPSLTLICGLPGSGKSTMARELFPNAVLCEADQYFTKADGTYAFNANDLPEAHRWCQNKAARALQEGRDVVVANTFTRRWEMQPYFDMADIFGIKPTVITATGNYPNIHGVPPEAIERMRQRWED